ncbi:Branched-chain amino acid ABC transporter ATP-binding protein LivG [Geoglobus acetivorans]|uniref:Lipopolysaccharide export system ATP-binding protein LptB n=1 Tax=Geoglobus acetivorans TaxID=565033 RepID=A0A0A7GCR6_GEOAI|nr:Branched-chain amino acid ABC transporter ATP-binding protein LivG [Geoglobus acetivorans]
MFFDGKDITGKRPSELVKLGLVRTFQIIRAFRNMTVEENFLAVGGEYEDIMKELGLWSKRNMVAKNLSQGDLRKLNIGLSLATQPKLLLLDEPFSGLSPKECAELHSVIDHLKERGVTMVIIEHKLKELFSHVERVLVLNYGILLCEGKPDEVVNDVKVIEAYLGDGYAVA